MFQNLGDLFSKVSEFQAKMKDIKEGLSSEIVSAEAGGGMVKATVNGNKELVSLTIEKELIKPEDAEMLQDLVVAAVNKAMVAAEGMARQRMEELTRSVIPGGLGNIDLSRFGL
jgi:DNA-binding YbaB/EbfC family protein